MRKRIASVVLSILFVTIAVVGCSGLGTKNNDTTKVEQKVEQFAMDSKAFYGKKEAKNQIVVFADYECGACRSFHETTFKDLMKKYTDKGKAKIYNYDLAFINESSLIKASLALQMEKSHPDLYTQYVDAMYAMSAEESTKFAKKDYALTKMKELFPSIDTKVMVEKSFGFDIDLNQKGIDVAELAKKVGVQATPAIFVNGIKVQNPFDLNEIDKLMK